MMAIVLKELRRYHAIGVGNNPKTTNAPTLRSALGYWADSDVEWIPLAIISVAAAVFGHGKQPASMPSEAQEPATLIMPECALVLWLLWMVKQNAYGNGRDPLGMRP